MRSDRELTALFAGAIADERADPTFLDELFEVLVAEVAAEPGLAPRRPAAFPVAARRVVRLGAARARDLRSLQSRLPSWTIAVAAVLATVIGSLVVFQSITTVGPPPSPSPSPSPSPTPAATWQIVPATTFSTFSSSRYGYSVGYPSNWKTHQSAGELGELDYPYDFSAGVDYLSASSPDVLDPGLIIAAPRLTKATDLAGWMANVAAEQGTALGCAPPDATEPTTVAGLPAQIDTWNHCPVYLLWAGFVRSGRAYHVLLIDQFAEDNPPLQAADKALFLRILGSLTLTGPTPTFGPAPLPSVAPSPAGSARPSP